MPHLTGTPIRLAAATAFVLASITSAAGAQGTPAWASDVLNVAKQIAGLIDRLADTGKTDEDQLSQGWVSLNKAEVGLPPEIKNRVGGSGPPKGYIACHTMLGNASNDARIRWCNEAYCGSEDTKRRAAQRAHALTKAAIACYVKELK